MDGTTDRPELPVRIARWLLIAAVAVVPLLMSRLIGAAPVTHDSYELPKVVVLRVLLGGALFAWCVALVRSGRLRWSWWLLPLGLYAGWATLATVFSPAPATSFLGLDGSQLGLVSVLTSALLGFVALQVFDSATYLKSLSRAIVVSGLLVSLLGVLQVLGLDPFFYFPVEFDFTVGRVFSTFGNPVFLAGYLVILIPVTLTLALVEQHRVWKTLSWVSLSLACITLQRTETRAAWIVVGIEVVLFVVVLHRKRVTFTKADIAGALTSLLVTVGATVASFWNQDRYLNAATRMAMLLSGRDGSAAARAVAMTASVRAILARPLFGFGPDRDFVVFRMFLTRAEAAKYANDAITNAHSVPLQIAATTGVVAAGAWLACWLIPLAGNAKRTLSSRGSSSHVLFAGVWIALAGHAMFALAGIQVAGVQALSWVLLGAMAGVSAREIVLAKRQWTVALAGLSAVGVLVAVASGAMLVSADHEYMLSRMQGRGYLPGNPLVAARIAASESPLDIAYLREVWIDTDPQDHAAMRAALDRALALDPDDLQSLLARHALAVSMGERKLAAQLLHRLDVDARYDPGTLAASREGRS
jgi:O-antigen ligase